MALCTAHLTLNSASTDNPMDGAIYHPTRGSFFAVRAGYISEYSASLTLLQGPTKFASSVFGRSCIAYDSVNDRIWVGTNGDWAAGYLGDAGGANPAKSTVGLYRIVPTTLALEAFIDPTTITTVGAWSSISGVYDVLVANGKLFATFGDYKGQNSIQHPTCAAFALNLPAYTLSWQSLAGGIAVGFNTQMAHDSSNQLWINQDFDNYNNLFPAFGADTGSPGSSVNLSPTNGAHCAIAFSTVGGGAIYMVQMPNLSLAKYNFTTGNKISEPNLAGATIGGMTSRIRFNANDNLLYIPCPAANNMIAFNPLTDTVSTIYSGLDSPHDAVFGVGIRVAIQQGPTGLKVF